MKQRLVIVVLLGLLLLAATNIIADWISGPEIPYVPEAIERAGFTELQQVRKTSGEAVGGAESVIVFEAEAPAAAEARIIREPCSHDHPEPAAEVVYRDREVAGEPRIIIERAFIEITPAALGGNCRQQVLERDGNWWTQAHWTGWVDIQDNQRVQRGPIPANTVLVAEVAKPYTPKRVAVSLFGGFQTGADEPGWYAGALVRWRKHIGVTGYLARDLGDQTTTASQDRYFGKASRNRAGIGVSWTF
jgi:hypothetical protein